MLTARMRRAASDDRGAVAVIVIVLFASMVLFAMGALAIDTGQFYSEKAQLQNGADAAAVAIAETCAKGTCDTSLANHYANANANDNKSDIDSDTPCGNGGGLASCAQANLCPDPPAGANWVDVQTSTHTSDDQHALPPVFGKAVLGDKYNGQIHACAQAVWGFPGKATVAPFAISQCEFIDAIGNGDPSDPPPYLVAPDNTPLPLRFPVDRYDGTGSQNPVQGGETVVALHGTPNAANGGSFDTGADSWAGSKGTPKPVSVTQDTTFFQAGLGSLKTVWSAGASGAESALATNVPSGNPTLTVGSVYVLTGWVYGNVTSPTSPAVRLYVKNGASQVFSATQVGDGSWHQLTIQFTAASTRVDLGLITASASTANQVTWLDEVSLQLKNNPRCAGFTPNDNPPSGWDQPGGFGWLADTDGTDDCSVTVNVAHTIWDNTGASLPTKCKSVLQNASCAYNAMHATPPTCQPSVLYVPIFDWTCKQGSCDTTTNCYGGKPAGSNGCYHFTGFAGFVPSGFQLNGAGGLTQSSLVSNVKYCTGNDKCVYGFFIGEFAELPNSEGGGEDFGISFFNLSG
jgi:hypothetical protein